MLRLLKQHLPDSQIYWWIESGLAPLLEGDPDLAGIVRFERKRWASPKNWVKLARSLRWLRAQNFDWVIDLQCLARSGAFAWLANGKLTIGLDEPREGARGYYDLVARRPSFHTHAVDWCLRVLPLLNVPVHRDFRWLPVREEVASHLREKWAGDSSWLSFQPGARWLNKRWPVEHFAELLARVAAAYPSHRVAILGSDDDKPLAQTILKTAPGRCLDLTGQLSLPEMVEWVRLSKVLVTNDTGPMHVAAALGTPIVGLFGPTEPQRTGPYGQLKHVLQLDLPCVPCLKSRCTWSRPQECLRGLRPAAAFAALEQRLVGR